MASTRDASLRLPNFGRARRLSGGSTRRRGRDGEVYVNDKQAFRGAGGDRGHELSLRRWRTFPPGALGPGRIRRRRDRRLSDRPWLGPGDPVRQWLGRLRHELFLRGRLSLRRRRFRRGVLWNQSARGLGDGSAAAAAARSLLGSAGERRYRSSRRARQPDGSLRGGWQLAVWRGCVDLRGRPKLSFHGQAGQRGVRQDRLRIRPRGTGCVGGLSLFVLARGAAPWR